MNRGGKECLVFALIIHTVFWALMGYYGALCIYTTLTTPL